MQSIPRLTALALACSMLALTACGDRDAEDREAQLAREDATPATTPAGQPPAPAPTPATGLPPGGAPTVPAPQAGDQALGEADREFLRTAAQSNQKELRAAELAMERAENEDVRAYAERMERDHTRLGEQMQPLLQQAGIDAQQAEPASPELQNASGAEFDRAYMQQMVQDHQQAVVAFEGAANGEQYSQQVRTRANEALPMLRNHLEEARRLSQQLGEAQGQGG